VRFEEPGDAAAYVLGLEPRVRDGKIVGRRQPADPESPVEPPIGAG
jgi:hypothetical protein